MQTISQTQMNAFEQCRRLYYLRYIEKLVWPGAVPDREGMQRGDDFHLLVRQLILGLPRESLLFPEDDGTMARWIGTFLREKPLGDYDRIFAEKEVSALFADVFWFGKFDAVTLKGDRLTIFDWKTGKKKTDPERFRRSPQTRLYLMLAARCGSRLFGLDGERFPAENIEMIYWFPEHPETPLRIPYSENALQKDLTWMKMRAVEMSRTEEAAYPRTNKTDRCPFCAYYSYCCPEDAVRQWDVDPGDAEEMMQGEFLFPELPPEEDPFSY